MVAAVPSELVELVAAADAEAEALVELVAELLVSLLLDPQPLRIKAPRVKATPEVASFDDARWYLIIMQQSIHSPPPGLGLGNDPTRQNAILFNTSLPEISR